MAKLIGPEDVLKNGLTMTIEEWGGLAEPTRVSRKQKFANALAVCGTIRGACEMVGIPTKLARSWLQDDGEFKTECDFAFEDFVDMLATHAHELAMQGNYKMLMFLLAGYRRQRFGNEASIMQVFNNTAKDRDIDMSKLSKKELQELESMASKVGIKLDQKDAVKDAEIVKPEPDAKAG